MATFRKIAVRPDQFGSRDFQTTAKIVEVPIVAPGAGEVLVKVAAAGIEASDIVQMSGGYGALAESQPATSYDGTVQAGDLGFEGVGIIVGLGPDILSSSFCVGQAVAWMGYGSGFREYVLLKAGPDVANVQVMFKVPRPTANWTAVPCSALTATGGLELEGRISQGQSVLVTGAAGGTGHIAVQWAKTMWGARVAGTCGNGAKAQLLHELGCDVVVNYREQDMASVLRSEFPRGFDLVYEAVGGNIGRTAQRLLAPDGTLVSLGAVSEDYAVSGISTGVHREEDRDLLPVSPVMSRTRRGQQTLTGFFSPAGPDYPGWARLVDATVAAVASGKIRVVLDEGSASFAGLEGVYKAQARMRLGDNCGKVYATIDPALVGRVAKL